MAQCAKGDLLLADADRINRLCGAKRKAGFLLRQFVQLSYRDMLVLMCLLEGRNVEEIAERLNVSRARISQVMLGISGKLLEKMNEDDNDSNSGS